MKAFNFLDKIGTINTNTMVLDKGLNYKTMEDMLTLTGEYFNLIKYGWGTSILYNKDLIKEKNNLYHSYDIKTYTGGTLFELANMQNQLDAYLEELDNLGFNAIEISDGSTEISPEKRADVIDKTKDMGFYILTEVGKKNPEKDSQYTTKQRIDLINTDIENKVNMVIIEARESGKKIGIFDNNGNIKEDELTEIQTNTPHKKVMWEAPQKNQQAKLILKLGNDVNLGNINTNDIISLETLRRGLRGDTLGKL